MIDWHSHILPGLDDGSRNVAESISLINMQEKQGVRTVVATPHFYANDESVEAFLTRRKRSMESLEIELSEGGAEIVLGAEIRYYQGISRMQGLKKLMIEGSKIMLLEMPVARWTEYMVRELIELSSMGGTKVALAHIERYLKLQRQDAWQRIRENGILMQANASFFVSHTSRHKAISLLREGHIHIVGSDCHNMVSRPPQIGKAFEIIQKKLGSDYIGQMNEYGYDLLATINN